MGDRACDHDPDNAADLLTPRKMDTQRFGVEVIDKASAALARIGSGFDRLGNVAKGLSSAIQGGMRQAGDSIGALPGKLDAAAGKMKSLGASMQGIGATMTAAVTLPIVALGAASTGAFLEYEQSLAELSKATNLSGDDLDQLGAAFTRMAVNDIPLATNELMGIAAGGAKLGIASSELERFTALTATMSTAFDIGAEDVTDQTAKIANSFKILNAETGELNFDRMTMFGDTVNNLADNMATSEAKILNAVSRMAGITQPFGFTENETAALAAGFTALGMESDVAARAVNSSMQQLANAPALSAKAQAALSQMGYEVKDLQQQFLSGNGKQAYMGFLKDIESMGADAIPLLTEIFGKGFSDEMARGGVGIEQFAKAFDLIDESAAGAGATMQKSMDIMGKTGKAELTKLNSAFTDFQVTIGAIIVEALAPFAASLKDTLVTATDFAKANPGITKFGVALAGIAAATGVVVVGVGSVLAIIGSAITAVGTIGTAIGGISTVIGGAIGGIVVFATPLLSAIGSIASAIGGIPALLATAGGAIAEAAGTALTAVSGFVSAAIPAVISFGATVATALVQGAIAAAPFLLAAGAIAGAAYLIYKNWEPIKGFFKGVIDDMQVVGENKAFETHISKELGVDITNAGDLSNAMFDQPLATLAAVGTGYINAFGGLWDGFWSNVTSGVRSIGIEANYPATRFGVAFGDVWSGLTSWVNLIGSDIGLKIAQVQQAIGNAINSAVSGVVNVGINITAGIGNVIASIAAGIGNVIGTVAAGVGNVIGGVANLASQAIAGVGNIASAFMAQFTAIGAGVVSALSNVVAGAATIATGAMEAITGVRDAIVSAITGVRDKIQSALSSIPNPFANLRAPSFSAPAMPSFAGVGASVRIGNSAQGNIPQSAQGLITAAARESRAMPSGANLTVANTSELIIPSNRIGGLLGNIAAPSFSLASPQQQATVTGTAAPSITVNITATTNNPQEIASLVSQAIDKQWRSWSAGLA